MIQAFKNAELERDWMKEFSFKAGEDNVCVPLVVCFPLVEEYEKWSIVPTLRESTVSTCYVLLLLYYVCTLIFISVCEGGC